MHPVIRLVSFVVFAGCVAWSSIPGLLTAFLVLALTLVVTRGAGLMASARMFWRLRWLVLSIAVVYLWLTPGQPLLASFADPWVPTWDGLYAGAARIGVLMLIVVAVNVLTGMTPAPEIMAALVWLCAPLKRIGFSAERLALRLVLTTEALAALRVRVAAGEPVAAGTGRVQRWAQAGLRWFRFAAEQGERAACTSRRVVRLNAPRRRDWTYPLGLLLLFIGLGYL